MKQTLESDQSSGQAEQTFKVLDYLNEVMIKALGKLIEIVVTHWASILGWGGHTTC